MSWACWGNVAKTSVLPSRGSRPPRAAIARKLPVALAGLSNSRHDHRMSKSNPNVFRLLSHMLAAVFNSRAAFHREWQRGANQAASDLVTGRWTGEWVSEKSGHRGKLRCVMTEHRHNYYR